MEKNANAKSIGMLHLAVMLFGLSGAIGKLVEADAFTIAFGRSALSACLLFVYLLTKKEPLRLLRAKDALLLAAAGVTLAAHWVSFFQSIKAASVAIGTITFSTFPLFLVFLEPLMFREKFKKTNLLFAALLIAGVLVTIPEFSLSNGVTAGVLWGMAGSLTYAALSLMNRSLSGRYSGAKVCLYEQAAAAGALFPVVLAQCARPGAADIAGIAVIGTVCT
ncbi:MAG TPA: DMT family transporter, partial [Clostridia bacterium]|nr:DMT family transporter [Clostridia bacterium]